MFQAKPMISGEKKLFLLPFISQNDALFTFAATKLKFYAPSSVVATIT